MSEKEARKLFKIERDVFEPFEATFAMRIIKCSELADKIAEVLAATFADFNSCKVAPAGNGQVLGVTLLFNQVPAAQRNANAFYAYEPVTVELGKGDMGARISAVNSISQGRGKTFRVSDNGYDVLKTLLLGDTKNVQKKDIDYISVETAPQAQMGFMFGGFNSQPVIQITNFDIQKMLETLVFGSEDSDNGKIYYSYQIGTAIGNPQFGQCDYLVQLFTTTDQASMNLLSSIGINVGANGQPGFRSGRR